MDDLQEGGQDVAMEGCGCAEAPRRLCDICRTDSYGFTACSLRCLRRHQQEAHAAGSANAAGDAGAAPDTENRMREFQKQLNRHSPNVWQRYAGHRANLMGYVPAPAGHRGGGDGGGAAARGGAVCVFGAGSCSDVDLEQLWRTFDEVHLVDLDGEALERARDRQPEAVREGVVLHGDVDLSGFMNRLDLWGDSFPSDAELGQAAVAAAHGIVRGIGRPFDVTVSSCVLSQLMQPFQSAWILSESDWSNLDAAVTAVHLATLAGATRAGGSGFIAFDVLSSEEIPSLAALQGGDAADLQSFVQRELATGTLVLQPDPENLLAQLGSPGLGSLFASPRLTSPWLWDIGDAIQLVYGLQFQRR